MRQGLETVGAGVGSGVLSGMCGSALRIRVTSYSLVSLVQIGILLFKNFNKVPICVVPGVVKQ